MTIGTVIALIKALAVKTITGLKSSGGVSDAGKILAVDSNGDVVATELTVGTGEVAIDPTLTVSGAGADAREVGDRFDDVNSSLSAIAPKNFKDTLVLSDLREGVTTIANTALGNYDASTMKQIFRTANEGYLYKVDLSKITSGTLYGDAHTAVYTGTARAFAVCTGDDDDIYVCFSQKWTSSLVSYGTWLTVADDKSWTVNIRNIITEYADYSYGAPTALYIWSEYNNEVVINWSGVPSLPDWLDFVGEQACEDIAQEVVDTAISEALPTPEIVLPSDSVAVVGHQWHMYLDNIINYLPSRYYVTIYAPTMTSSSMYLLDDELRISPIAGDVGSHSITVTIRTRATDEVVVDNSFTLHVIEDATLTDKKVIFIGDSLTDAGVYPAEIQYNLSDGGITSLGTRSATVTIDGTSRTVSHEGRSGWGSYNYTGTESGNAFYNDGFDFSYYMTQQGYDSVDAVCIGLGTNGASVPDTTVEKLSEMIASIRTYSATVPIIIGLPCPPATQDGVGKKDHLQLAPRLKLQLLNIVKRYLTEYQGTEDAYLDVAELYFNLDTKRDFATVTEDASSRNPTQVTRQNNNVHPSVYGYLKIADAWYNRLLYHLA